MKVDLTGPHRRFIGVEDVVDSECSGVEGVDVEDVVDSDWCVLVWKVVVQIG